MPAPQKPNAVRNYCPTSYDKRVAKLMTTTLRKKLRSWLLSMIRHRDAVAIEPTLALGQCLPELSGLHNPTISMLSRTKAWYMVQVALSEFVQCYMANDKSPLVAAVVKSLAKDAAITDVRLRLPPPAKEPRQKRDGPPPSLVERRAAAVDDKLANWQRKLRLAKTKVAALKKRQAYYRRKGVV